MTIPTITDIDREFLIYDPHDPNFMFENREDYQFLSNIILHSYSTDQHQNWIDDPKLLKKVFSKLVKIASSCPFEKLKDFYCRVILEAKAYHCIIPRKNALDICLFAQKNLKHDLLISTLRYLQEEYHYVPTCEKQPGILPPEENFFSILRDMHRYSLHVTKSCTGVLEVIAMGEFNQEHADCLRRLNQLFPITFLTLEDKKNLGVVLELVMDLKLISLDMGTENVDEAYLSALVEKLPDIKYFYIHSAKITTLPPKLAEGQLEMLDVSDTYLYETHFTIKTNARNVTCRECTHLISLTADEADTVNYSFSHNIKYISANRIKQFSYPTQCLEYLSVNSALEVDCTDSPNLKYLSANSARKVDSRKCPNLEIAYLDHVEEACFIDEKNLKFVSARYAKDVFFSRCHSLEKVNVDHAKRFCCKACPKVELVNANHAKKIILIHCLNIKEAYADNAEKVTFRTCPNLKILSLKSAKKIRGCKKTMLTHLYVDTLNPDIKGIDLMQKGLTLTGRLASRVGMIKAIQASDPQDFEQHYQALINRGFENPQEASKFIQEGEFKLRLLKKESIRSYIEILQAKLLDPESAEKVSDEISDFSKWAAETNHAELANWLLSLKEDIPLAIEVIHRQANERSLLKKEYELSRQAQNESLQKNKPNLNLSQLLDNPVLNTNLKALYSNIPPPSLSKMQEDLADVLDIQLSILYPNEDNEAYITKVLSFPKRIMETADFQIDPKRFGQRLGMIVNHLCTFNTAQNIECHRIYLRQHFDILLECAEACVNRAAEALHKAEGLYFLEHYKDNKELLYGTLLMLWKRAFVKEYVLLKTLPTLFEELEQAVYDVEIILTNCKSLDPFLNLNLGTLDVKYLDSLKAHLRNQGKSDEVICDPNQLFAELLKLATVEQVLDYLSESPYVQKLFEIEPIIETSEELHIRVSKLAFKYAESLDETFKAESLQEITTLAETYEMLGFNIQTLITQDLKDLELASGTNYNADQAEKLAFRLGNRISSCHYAYRYSILKNDYPGSFKDRLRNDLLTTNYLVLPTKIDGSLCLDYPPPRYFKGPNDIVKAALCLNVEDCPSELK